MEPLIPKSLINQNYVSPSNETGNDNPDGTPSVDQSNIKETYFYLKIGPVLPPPSAEQSLRPVPLKPYHIFKQKKLSPRIKIWNICYPTPLDHFSKHCISDITIVSLERNNEKSNKFGILMNTNQVAVKFCWTYFVKRVRVPIIYGWTMEELQDKLPRICKWERLPVSLFFDETLFTNTSLAELISFEKAVDKKVKEIWLQKLYVINESNNVCGYDGFDLNVELSSPAALHSASYYSRNNITIIRPLENFVSLKRKSRAINSKHLAELVVSFPLSPLPTPNSNDSRMPPIWTQLNSIDKHMNEILSCVTHLKAPLPDLKSLLFFQFMNSVWSKLNANS